jgi:hypothetical protein
MRLPAIRKPLDQVAKYFDRDNSDIHDDAKAKSQRQLSGLDFIPFCDRSWPPADARPKPLHPARHPRPHPPLATPIASRPRTDKRHPFQPLVSPRSIVTLLKICATQRPLQYHHHHPRVMPTNARTPVHDQPCGADRVASASLRGVGITVARSTSKTIEREAVRSSRGAEAPHRLTAPQHFVCRLK